MRDKVTGVLEVGINDVGEVVVNHPDLKPDENGVGHIIFSPRQARNLARLLSEKAAEAEANEIQRLQSERLKQNESIPVDHSARILTDGSPVTPEHRYADVTPEEHQSLRAAPSIGSHFAKHIKPHKKVLEDA